MLYICVISCLFVFPFSLGSLQIRYKLNYYHDPDVFTINSKNLADGHLHRVSILRKQDILFVEVLLLELLLMLSKYILLSQ